MCIQIPSNVIVLVPRIGLFIYDIFLSQLFLPQAMVIQPSDDQHIHFLPPVDSDSGLSENMNVDAYH
jgi:hypothetical protein